MSKDGGTTTPGSAYRDYETAAKDVMKQLEIIQWRVVKVHQAITANDSAALRMHLDGEKNDLAALNDAISRLETATGILQAAPSSAPSPGIQRPLIVPIVAIIVLVKGLRDFAGWLQEKRVVVEMAKKEEEDACLDIDTNNPSAGRSVDACKAARKKINDLGVEVLQETTKKIVVETVLSPINPATTGGVLLKDKGGNLLGNGIDVVTATKACESAPRGPDCRIGAAQTNPLSRVPVPAGPLVMSVSGRGHKRVVLDGVDIQPGKMVTITLDLEPIDSVSSDGGASSRDGDAVNRDSAAPSPDTAVRHDGASSGPDGGSASDAPAGNPFPVIHGARYTYEVSLTSYSDGNKSTNGYVVQRTLTRSGNTAKISESVTTGSVDTVLEGAAGFWALRESWADGKKVFSFAPPWRLAPMDGFVPGQQWKDSSTITITDPGSGKTAIAQVTITTSIASTRSEITVAAGRFTGALVLTRDQWWTYQPRQTTDDQGNPVTLTGTRHIVDRETYAPGVGMVHQHEQDDETTRAATTSGTIESNVNTTTDQRLSRYAPP